MLVEKLYIGMFVVDPENLLVFVAEQIAMVRGLPDADLVSDSFRLQTVVMIHEILCLWQALERKHPQREATVSVLYKSLNRSVLYFLSRPRQAPAEKELILRTLHVVQQHWDIIMATYNSSVHFISCLLHCLLLIRSGRSSNFHATLIAKRQIFTRNKG